MTNYSEIQNPKSAFQRGFTLIEIIVVIVILVHCLGYYY